MVSLYLNLAADQHGRDNYDAFLRKAFAEHLEAFDPSSAERASLERDVERITAVPGRRPPSRGERAGDLFGVGRR